MCSSDLRWLLTQPEILLLDDPTRGIDVGAKAELYALIDRLCRDGLGVILTSSELPELLTLADRILGQHDEARPGEGLANRLIFIDHFADIMMAAKEQDRPAAPGRTLIRHIKQGGHVVAGTRLVHDFLDPETVPAHHPGDLQIGRAHV